jgi:predicted site-specific integrase-resolvase
MNKNDQAISYIPIRDVCKITGTKHRSAKLLAEKAGVKTFVTPSGQTKYCRQDLLSYINDHSNMPEKPAEQKRYIVYCRVSSKKQEPDLQRQIELARSEFPGYEIICDIASGINWHRKGLHSILELAMRGNIAELVVLHRDRLSRQGFDLFEQIITLSGGKLTVVDKDSEQSSEQELAEDLLSIIHIYSCRQMGKRRYKGKLHPKDQKDEAVPVPEAEGDIKIMV